MKRKSRALAHLEETATADLVEPKSRAVTQSPKKKARGYIETDKQDEDRKPKADSVKEDLSSALDAASNADSGGKEEGTKIQEEDPESESAGDTVTAETVFGFPSCRDKTNREIVTENYGFVRWARKQSEPYGNLLSFLKWLDTPIGKALELDGQGNQTFGFGQHRGKTFKQVAESDPVYHERYMSYLDSKGQQPDETLKRYISFLKNYNGKMKRSKTNSLGNKTITFGQHKGKTFRWVAENDPSYHLRYLDMNPFDATRRLKEYMEYFDCHGNAYEANREHGWDMAAACGVYLPDDTNW